MSLFKRIFCIVYASITLTLAYAAITPNYSAAKKALAPDVSSYADYIVENCELPDGKIVTVYVHNNLSDGWWWERCQEWKYDPEHQGYVKEENEKYKNKEKSDIDFLFEEYDKRRQSRLNWAPTGPLSRYFEVAFSIRTKYGEKVRKQYIEENSSPITYYNVEDLGELSNYMKEESIAQASYEDSAGVYLVTICRPKNLRRLEKKKEEQRKHKDQLAYDCTFVPKEIYANIEPPKLTPSKTKSINPSEIPDSKYDLYPATPTGNSPYYYDENLAYKLQWLAVKVACKGTYDMAYTGDFSAKNPIDYYKTSFIKSYLAKNDGKASKGTLTFEGICFDYADFAYQEVSSNKNDYPDVAHFYIVGTFDDSNDIITYRLAKQGESSDMIINRTPVVVYTHNRVRAHDSARHHAWFWLQTTDGTVYWVDPTWTDNSGRPVFGIVRGGQEIQLSPSSSLCVN